MVLVKNFLLLYICSQIFKRRLMVSLSVKACDMRHVLVPFRTVVTFLLASASVVGTVQMLVDSSLSQEFTSKSLWFSSYFWFIIFERVAFALPSYKIPFFFLFFLASGSFLLDFDEIKLSPELLNWLSR